MIKKVIHYCWFGGGPIPRRIEKCMRSWSRIMPGVEIKRWDESNYDVNAISYTAAAYQDRKWAFVSDYARLDIIYRHGGIYLDVDVELLRDLSPLLADTGFCATDDKGLVSTGLILAAQPHDEMIKEMRDAYLGYEFLDENGRFASKPCPVLQTEILRKHGYRESQDVQRIGSLTVYPARYFSPMDYRTRKLVLTNQTYAIHHWAESWVPQRRKWMAACRRMITRLFGQKVSAVLVQVKRHMIGTGEN